MDNTELGTRSTGMGSFYISPGIMAGYTFNSSVDATLLNLTIAVRNQMMPGTYSVLARLMTVDGSGNPDLGSVTASAKFSIAVPEDPPEYRTMALPGNFTMAAGTTYALVLSDDSDLQNQAFNWMSTQGDPSPTAGNPFTLIAQKFTNNNATSWLTDIMPASILLYASAAIA